MELDQEGVPRGGSVEQRQSVTANHEVAAATGPNKDQKMWAMFCHLAGLARFVAPVPFAGIIAPLVVWQIKKDEHPFVDRNGKEAVNFQISMAIYLLVAILLIFVVVGIFLLPAVAVFNIVFLIIAGVKANNGEHYEYPMTIRFIK